MKRRTFIKVGISLSALAIVGFTIPSFKKTVVKILLKDTAQLKIDRAAIDQFITDGTREQFWLQFSLPKKVILIGFTYVGFLKKALPYYNKYVRYRGQITGHFLLSTNFILNKMNPDEPVRYVQFYNPYKQPCSNPFSVNFYPETV